MAHGSITNCSVSIRRNWFSPGFHSVLTLSGKVEPFGLPYVVEGFSRILSELLKADPLIDFKGADSGVYQTGTAAPHLEDPVVEIAGNSILPSTADEAAAERESFEFAVKSRFKSFRGEGSIVHTAHDERRGALPGAVTLKNIGRVFPLEILRFTVGFDLYTPRRYPLLGVSPVVNETVRIEADRERFSLVIDSDYLPKRTALPLQRVGLFDKFAEALRRVFAFDLAASYPAGSRSA